MNWNSNPASQLPTLVNTIYLDSKKIKTTSHLVLRNRFSSLRIVLKEQLSRSISNGNVAYRLTGLDSNWINVGTDRVITLYRLPAGNYGLEIRNTSGAAPLNELINLEVNDNPPGKNLLLFGLLGTALIFAYYKWPKEKTSKPSYLNLASDEPNEMVEQKMSNRMSTAQQMGDKNAQMNFITLMFHDIRSHLVFLEKVCNQIYLSEKTKNPNIAKAMGEIRSTSVTLCGFAESFTPWILLKDKKIETQTSEIQLKSMMDDLAATYASMAEFRNNEILTNISPDLRLHNDERLIRIIVRNLIDNANKNTRQGRITLSAYQSQGMMHIEVRDTGKGLNEKQLEDLNRLFNSDSKTELKGSGLGLLMIADLVRITKGTCQVKSDNGASFQLRFPNLS